MDISLTSLAPRCQVTGRDFAEGDRVVSFLLRAGDPAAPEALLRHDVLAAELANYQAPGAVVCRWTQAYKPRKAGENPERNLKLTAEHLFLTLSDPATERSPETERLLVVLAMMLERKRVLRPQGRVGTGSEARLRYEHARLKSRHEVTAAELSPEFFLSIQEQLAALVGGGGSGSAPASAGEPSAPGSTASS
jgi:hypothetical protein